MGWLNYRVLLCFSPILAISCFLAASCEKREGVVSAGEQSTEVKIQQNLPTKNETGIKAVPVPEGAWGDQIAQIKATYKGQELNSRLEDLYYRYTDSHSILESLEFLLAADITEARRMPLAQVLKKAAQEEPERALEWMKAHAGDLYADNLVSVFGCDLATSHRDFAVRELPILDLVRPGQKRLRAGLLSGLARTCQEPAEVFAYANRIEGKGIVTEDYSSIASGLRNAGRYAECLDGLALLAVPEVRGTYAVQQLADWATSDGPAAVSYLNRYAFDQRAAAFENVYGQWGTVEPKAAGEALLRITSPPDRAAALRGFLPVLAKLSPEEAKEFEAVALTPKPN
jgi:hypothetical protein